MEGKVLLYDAEGKKIGETFARRARQLVKQQRAVWMDDRQAAAQFVADVDDWQTVDNKDEGPIPVFDDEGWVVTLAKKRILWRRLYVVHSVVFSLGMVGLAFALIGAVDANFGAMIAPDGANLTLAPIIAGKSTWFTAFIAHTVIFAVSMQNVRRPYGKDRVLEKEVAEIKRLMDK